MKKCIITSFVLLLVTSFSFSAFAGKTDKIKDEFNGSTNGWSYPADHHQGIIDITPDNCLRITRSGEGDWFMMQKTVTVDFNLYPEFAVRLTKEIEQGRWFFKIEQGDFWKELLPDNSYLPEIEGADEDYLNSIYVWDVRSILREEGISVTEPVTLNIQMIIEGSEIGNTIEFDWFRSDYKDDKKDPADDLTLVQVDGTLVDNMNNTDGWSVLGAGTIESDNGTLTIKTDGSDTWSVMVKEFSEDLSKYPYLSASIVGANRTWNVKFVADGMEKILNVNNANETGSMYVWNLSEITGLTGVQSFKIQVVAENGTDSYVTTDWIKSLNYMLRDEALSQIGAIDDNMNSAEGWRNIDAGEIYAENGMVGVRAQNGSTQGWYVIRKDYTENVDEYPYLSVTIGDFNEDWVVKVVAPNGEKELVKAEAYNSGKEYIWNMQRITGTNGANEYGIQLLALGNSGSSFFAVDDIKSLKYIDGTASGVFSLKTGQLKVAGEDGKIIVTIESGTQLRIFNVLGNAIYSRDVDAGTYTIPVVDKGIYFVAADAGVTKVLVK